jgi:hypothetical protein
VKIAMMEARQHRIGGNSELPDASVTTAEKARTSLDPASVMLVQDDQVSRSNHKHSRSEQEADPDDSQSKKPKAVKDPKSFTSKHPVSPTVSHLSPEKVESGKLQVIEDDISPIPAATVGISDYGENDVLSGRGGGTNVHPGNRNFRDLINLHRRTYLKARKNDKPAISRAIVRSIREVKGKFLKKDEKSGLWFEIGDDAAREKTSQALRQRAPEMRKLLFDTEMEEAKMAVEAPLSPPPQQQHQQQTYRIQPQQQPQAQPTSIVMGMPAMAQVNMAAAAANPLTFNPTFMGMANHIGNSNSYGDFPSPNMFMAPMLSNGMFIPTELTRFHSANPSSGGGS